MAKDALLAELHRGRTELDTLLARVPRERLREPGVVGEWSVADVVAHLAAYEVFVGTALLDETVKRILIFGADPPEDLHGDAYNAWVVDQARPLPVDDVLAEERRGYVLIVQAVMALTDAEVAAPDRFPWLHGRLAERLPNQCYGHHRMHMPAIEAWLGRRSADRTA